MKIFPTYVWLTHIIRTSLSLLPPNGNNSNMKTVTERIKGKHCAQISPLTHLDLRSPILLIIYLNLNCGFVDSTDPCFLWPQSMTALLPLIDSMYHVSFQFHILHELRRWFFYFTEQLWGQIINGIICLHSHVCIPIYYMQIHVSIFYIVFLCWIQINKGI